MPYNSLQQEYSLCILCQIHHCSLVIFWIPGNYITSCLTNKKPVETFKAVTSLSILWRGMKTLWGGGSTPNSGQCGRGNSEVGVCRCAVSAPWLTLTWCVYCSFPLYINRYYQFIKWVAVCNSNLNYMLQFVLFFFNILNNRTTLSSIYCFNVTLNVYRYWIHYIVSFNVLYRSSFKLVEHGIVCCKVVIYVLI